MTDEERRQFEIELANTQALTAKLQAETAKLTSEISKFQAETSKLTTENRWYVAVVASGVALVLILATATITKLVF